MKELTPALTPSPFAQVDRKIYIDVKEIERMSVKWKDVEMAAFHLLPENFS